MTSSVLPSTAASPEDVEMPQAPEVRKPAVSKAALRRLAHDAGSRMTKQRYGEAADGFETFLQALVDRSVEAMRFSKKRSVGVSHVLFAARALNTPLPAEVLEASRHKEGIQLLRCNARAPPAARKASALSTEISGASFARVAKGMILKREAPPRLTAQARRMMHVLAELRVVETFGKAPSLAEAPREDPTERAVAAAFDCSSAVAVEITTAMARLCEKIPDLLEISPTKTIDLRLLAEAAAPLSAPAGPLPGARDAAVKIVDRIIRSSAVDRRVVSTGAAFVVAMMRETHGLVAPELPPAVPRGHHGRRPPSEPALLPEESAAVAPEAAADEAAAIAAPKPKARPGRPRNAMPAAA